MNREELNAFMLTNLLEEHLWGEGEYNEFAFSGVLYKMEKVNNGFSLYTFNKISAGWNKPKTYPTMGRLFAAHFR